MLLKEYLLTDMIMFHLLTIWEQNVKKRQVCGKKMQNLNIEFIVKIIVCWLSMNFTFSTLSLKASRSIFGQRYTQCMLFSKLYSFGLV